MNQYIAHTNLLASIDLTIRELELTSFITVQIETKINDLCFLYNDVFYNYPKSFILNNLSACTWDTTACIDLINDLYYDNEEMVRA